MSADRVSVLKIDKDCFVDKPWLNEYLNLILRTCKQHRISVKLVKATRTKKGLHFYIQVTPSIESEVANQLQWLLGDDCRRVDFNRARIRSCLIEWNKLFEASGARMRTIYSAQGWSKRRFHIH